MPTLTRSTLTIALLLGLAGVATPGAAQEVIVFDDFPPIPGTTDDTSGLRRGTDQAVLVIPVVTRDTAFDAMNNLVDGFDPMNPNLHQDLVDKFDEVDDFWQENSFDQVSFDVEVLDRYFQMPRGVDHYFNPGYEHPELTGTEIFGPSVAVPSGQVRLVLHVSDSDETTLDLPFDAADSPYTFAEIEAAIDTALAPAGDKLELFLDNCGADCRRLRFRVPQIQVRAGTFIRVEVGASNAEVLDALGLDRPVVDLGVPRLTGVGGEFPYTSTAGDTLELTVENEVDPPESFVWMMGGGMLSAPADFIASHGATHAEVTVTESGGELRFAVMPTIGGPYTRISFSGPAELLDRLGLDTAIEVEGTINRAASNTIKGDRRKIAGQAIAAYTLNRMLRDGVPIDGDNENAIRTFLQNEIDPRRLISLIFLDAPNKRAGAAGGYIPVGLRNGGFELVHVTRGSVQIQYDFSQASTIAHETGHNIGFADLYNNSNGEYDPSLRYPVDWDVMHAEGLLPHTGGWHKEVDNGWLTAAGATVSSFPEPPATGVSEIQRYVLTPLELDPADYDSLLAGVPGGRTVTKLIQLPIGLGVAAEDHFLLVQNRARGQSFSRTLPQKPGAPDRGGVYVTDGISRRSFDFFRPQARNLVHPLTDRPLIGGNVTPILDSAPAADVRFPMTYPAYDGLEVDVVGELPGPGALSDRPSYLVDVTREQKNFLELSIEPWGAPPWESADIWLEHGDKEEADLSDVPLPGNGEPARWADDYDQAANGGDPLNWIRARVSNGGTVDATDVQIRVRVNTPGGMGASGTWTVLSLSEPVDIPAGESRILQVGWNPSVNSHTCVQVEVFRWVSTLGDRDPWNNRTQENVGLFEPTSNSPWGTTPFRFEIANDRSFPMDVAIDVEGLDPGYVLSLESWFVHVPSGETVTVEGILELDDAIIPPPDRVGGGLTQTSVIDEFRPRKPRADVFHVAGFLVGDEYRLPIGGITYISIPSVRTDVDADVSVDGDGNVVVHGTTEPPAPGIDLEVVLRYPSGLYAWVPVTTEPDGTFGTTVPPEEDGHVRVTVRIPPGQGAAGPDSGEEIVDTRAPGDADGTAAGAHQVSLFAGGLFTDDELPLEAGPEIGFRHRRRWSPSWSLEYEVGIVSTGDANGDVLLFHGQVQVLRHLRGGRVQPFVLAGLGAAHANGLGSSDSSLLTTLGVGADYAWTPRAGFRLDLRYTALDDLFGSGTTHNWQVQWGPTFSF